MKKLYIFGSFVALLFMHSMSIAQDQKDSPSASQAQTYAVMFYADWCGSCKTLDPVMKQARVDGNLDQQNVLFVKLDLTDTTSTNQAKLLADALGISTIYAENEGKTGYVVLVDAQSQKPLAMITKTMKSEEVISLIEKYTS